MKTPVAAADQDGFPATEKRDNIFDALILGGGPAGLSAALKI